jgi:hypothetical protein
VCITMYEDKLKISGRLKRWTLVVGKLRNRPEVLVEGDDWSIDCVGSV